MELNNGVALGKGQMYPVGSVRDNDLMSSVQAYRRRVASAYRSVKPTEMTTGILGAPFHVSPKVDGELWFLVLEAGKATLVNSHGKAIAGDIPLLNEVTAVASSVSGRVVIAGELFAVSAGKGRPRVGDVASALAGGAEAQVERLGFVAFDLLVGLVSDPAQVQPYAERLETLTRLLGAGKRVKAIKTDAIDGIGASFLSSLKGARPRDWWCDPHWGPFIRSSQSSVLMLSSWDLPSEQRIHCQ